MNLDLKFKPGDLVRVKTIGGPKMIVGTIWHDGNPPAYKCGWFSKDDVWREETFSEPMLERARA